MPTRAIRRHHRARLKHARRWYQGRDLSQEPRRHGQAIATPCACSCWMCRPRKNAGDTLQERRAREDFAADLLDHG